MKPRRVGVGAQVRPFRSPYPDAMKQRFPSLAIAALLFTLGCSSDEFHHRVIVIIPATVPSIDAGVMRASLWAYDPGLADGGAAGVDHQALSFSHREGKSTTLRMVVSGMVDSRLVPYLSVEGYVVLPDGEVRLLWDGQQGTGLPRIVVMQPVP